MLKQRKTDFDPCFKGKFLGAPSAPQYEICLKALPKIEEVAGTSSRDKHDTATPPSKETEEPPSKAKRDNTLHGSIQQPVHPSPVLPVRSTVS